MDTNKRTWYEVSTAIGSLPPLMPMPMPLVEKFDSEAEAVEWAERFRGFLKTQKRTKSHIAPTDEEIEFLGGNHCAIGFNGVTERTERRIV